MSPPRGWMLTVCVRPLEVSEMLALKVAAVDSPTN